MLGENFVTLVGTISRPTFKNVGQNNIGLFKGSLNIPTVKGTSQYIKLAAWGDIAESIMTVDPRTTIKIQGHIEESSYDGKCKHCQGLDKKYWTEVVIDNYVVLNTQEGLI